MSNALGQISAGPQWSDVGLAGKGGSTLSICLAEEANSSAEWECRVMARTEHGSFHVGAFRTRPPSRGEVASRLVAIVYFPGAKSWITSWRKRSGGTALSQAAVTLSAEDQSGTFPGVTPLVSGPGPAATRSFGFTPGIGAAPVLLATNGSVLFDVRGQLRDPAGPAGFALLFDQAAAPIAGDVPIFSRHIGSAAGVFVSDGTAYEYGGGAQGRPIVNTLWAAFSSTSDVFTPLAGNTFNATAELGLP